MSINKKNKNKIRRKNKEVYLYTLPIRGMSFASYHRLPNWVPNQSLDKILLSNGTKCKQSNLNSHEYLRKHEK